MTLNYAELAHLLECLRRIHGPGYAKNPEVAKLQGKLSIMLEVRHNLGDCTKVPIPLPEVPL